MTFFKSTAGLTGALECGERYRLDALVEKDEEDGLSPSFWTYAFYIFYLFYTQGSPPELIRGHLNIYQHMGKLS